VLQALAEEPAPDAPVAAVVADFEFGASGPEMEQLRGAAEAAAQLQAPLVASVGPSFFGKASAGEVARISNLRAHLEAPEYVKWRGLRRGGSVALGRTRLQSLPAARPLFPLTPGPPMRATLPC